MKQLPNLISFLRLFISPYVFVLAYRGEEKIAAFLFIFLALSDALDGMIARFLDAKTNLGKFLDPLADKFLLFFGLLSITVSTEIRADPLVIQLLFTRDLLLIIGTLFLKRFGFLPEPSFWGKLTTLFLSITVFTGFILNLYLSEAVLVFFVILQIISVALIVISAFDYGIKGISFLRNKLIIGKR